MKEVIYLNKKEGETPLETLENFRRKHKEYKDISITYAGRLDPMASGLLILLVGEKIKEKDQYLKLDKEYEFEILFGFSTDTYDILGKVISCTNFDFNQKEFEELIKQNIKSFSGKLIQKYPLFSSKTVKGKPLFSYARRGVEVDIPTREVRVKSLKFFKIKQINNKNLLQNMEKRIKKINGDFRQKEILKLWRKNLNNKNSHMFYIADFKIKCSSGTYVRSIANTLGEKIGISALAYNIKRTKIGNKKLANI